MAAPCPDDDALARFVERELDEPTRADIERHCETCERCADTVAYLVQAFAASGPAPAEDDAPAFPRPGQTLGRYTILDWVGAGAMGAVFSAFDPELDRRVALKILPPRADDDALPQRARFLAEARAMASVSHPNVIAVHDVGTHGDAAFFAMELVEGSTLAQWLGAGPRSRDEIVEVFAAAGRGLAAAHDGGLVHRDFKPANVLVGDDGRVRVIDFGLARFTTDTTDTPLGDEDVPLDERPLTRTGTILGTPAYMAPEQLEDARADARADQFAFFVSLYEALYDERPFALADLRTRREAIAAGRITLGPGPRGVPRRVQKLISTGLAADPAARHPSMRYVVERLTYRPWARWGPILAGVVATLGIGVGVRGAMMEGAGPRCDPDADRLGGVWDADRRTSLVAAVTAKAGPDSAAAHAATWLADQLDEYATRWSTASQAVCVASVERHEVSATMTELQLSCLRRAKQQLAANVDAAIEQGPAIVPHAYDVAAALPAVAACEDPDALASGPPPPSATQADAVDAQRQRLAQARAGWATGAFERARELAQEVQAHAEEIGYAPLRYEATLLRADAAGRIERNEEAREGYEQALDGALSIDDHTTAIAASAALACFASANLGEPKVGVAYGQTAIGLAERDEASAPDRAHAHRCLGRALRLDGRLQEAETHQRRAIEVLRDAGMASTIRIAKTHVELAHTLSRQRRFDDARVELEAALAIYRKDFGRSPDTASIAAELADILGQSGDTSQAREKLQEAREAWSAVTGPRSANVGICWGKLGNLDYRDGRYDEAKTAFETGQEILEEVLGPRHQMTLAMEASLANVLFMQGEHAAASEAYERLLPKFDAATGPKHPAAAKVRASAAGAFNEAGDFATARETAEAGLRACAETTDIPDDTCGDLALASSRARLQLGDHDGARTQLLEGERRYEAAQAWSDDVRRTADELRTELGLPARAQP